MKGSSKHKFKYIYGPVNSWRFGASLGIDLLSQEEKICNFDCIYCQLGKTQEYSTKRGFYVKEEDIISELKSLPYFKIDHITFSGMGEPTLAENLGDAINAIKSLNITPISVLTNSSLLNDENVRKELLLADVVSCKIDVYSEENFKLINKPKDIRFLDILSGIIKFRKEYKKKLFLQIMFIKENRDRASEIRNIALKVNPDCIHINTPRRYCKELALSPSDIMKIKKEFKGLNVLSIYDKGQEDVMPLNKEETLKRRGEIQEKH
ncbi:MAG: radical SAM protein [bacterium]